MAGQRRSCPWWGAGSRAWHAVEVLGVEVVGLAARVSRPIIKAMMNSRLCAWQPVQWRDCPGPRGRAAARRGLKPPSVFVLPHGVGARGEVAR